MALPQRVTTRAVTWRAPGNAAPRRRVSAELLIAHRGQAVIGIRRLRRPIDHRAGAGIDRLDRDTTADSRVQGFRDVEKDRTGLLRPASDRDEVAGQLADRNSVA